ncbi:hypothetical protein H0H81_002168 [Sphagnurus paluster]|uniref:Uncharacterized protein n=1 Tax=Sphagnurus paluster TaxID=117069 RepID=A0A9P7K404_9AGAR|nr:hypothetical protein H0H81_002168 [Sphagnurus paluster]
MSTETAHRSADNSNNFIARVDSDRTDESPFGSALTTPVDEEVILFTGIEQRILSRSLETYGKDAAVQDGGVDGHEFHKVIHDEAKLLAFNTLKSAPTPSPSLEQMDPNTKTGPRTRRRAGVSGSLFPDTIAIELIRS